mmetsp:Transcript_89089/g.237752  ORF Transcript_89089/g.237752 Transcript_89089/m.237752 type:complete len:96 (+) Transcript_89089:2032-2319(+)
MIDYVLFRITTAHCEMNFLIGGHFSFHLDTWLFKLMAMTHLQHGDSSSGLLRQGSNGVQEARDNQLLLVLSTLLESIFSAFRFTFQRKSAPQKEE